MSSPAVAPSRPVDAVCDAFVEEYAAADPVVATALGLPGHDGEVTDLSPDGFARREELLRRTLAAARAAEPTDDRERAAKEAFVERLGLDLERHEAGIPQAEVSVISSGLHQLRTSFDLMDTGSEAGWRAVDSRLAGVPAALEGYRRTLLEAAAAGRVSARRQYVEVAGQVRRWTGQQGKPSVFSTLVDAYEGAPDGALGGALGGAPNGSLADDLRHHADAATEAVAAFGRFLAEELAPRGRELDAVGEEHYTLASRYFLGTQVDLRETYAWGWEELLRIEEEMRSVASAVQPGASVEEVAARLDADPAYTVKTPEAFRDWMQALADRVLDELADVHFDIPGPVRRIECCLAPTQDGGVYYTGPSEDFARPGRMWWSVPAGVTRFNTWRETTTVFHEGVPGHHLQVAQTAYRSDLLNRWQRKMCWVSGSGEGWALYAERLMAELGWLDDPADRLGMLDAQAFRTARVVVDIGEHLQLTVPENAYGWRVGETWTPDLVWEFMRAHSHEGDETLRFEVNRYLGWPGQAPSYKVGERLWLQARADAQARQGSSFDLRSFHQAALDLGSIGLDPLVAALGRL